MDRAEETTFAWALFDQAITHLNRSSRARLCVRIGAGNQQGANIELLEGFALNDTALPSALAESLWAWMNGFTGSDAETLLRDLANRIRVTNVSGPLGSADEVHSQRPAPMVAQRSERATRRLVLAK
jgi:hypothetical protein